MLVWASTANALAPRAIASRTFSLHETGHLHLTSSSVVFPEPLGPYSATISPAAAIGNTWSGSAAPAWRRSSSRFLRSELWRTILLESLLLAVGCLTGAAFGLYGQQLLDRALANVINFPVVYP